MLIPVDKLDLIKANKAAKDKLPEGGIWRTIKGRKVYIHEGEILAGHIPGVTDTPEAKKATKKMFNDFKKAEGKKEPAKKDTKQKETKKPAKKEPAKKEPAKKEPAKKEPAKKEPAKKDTKKPADKKGVQQTDTPKKEEPKKTAKQKKAEEEAAKARAEIDALAGENAKAEAKRKKKTVEEAKKESKAATDEALKNPNKKGKAGKSATKEDLDQVVKDNEAAKKKKKKGKGATKADLDAVLAENEKNKPKSKPVTKEDLDELFGTGKEEPKPAKGKGKGKASEDVAVIRSEKQTNNEIAYDVGKKIGGARKDLAAEQKAVENLMGRKSGQSLEELEKIAPELAQKHCVKKNILPPVNFEAEFKSGTDINVAMAKQLVYDRIVPKPDGDTPEDRKKYLAAMQTLQRALEPIKKWDEFKEAIRNLGDHMKKESPKYVQDHLNYLAYAKKKLAEPITEYDRKQYNSRTSSWEILSDEDIMAKRQKRVDEEEAAIAASIEVQKKPYSPLGEKLMNFFTDYESRNRTFDTISKKKLSWDTYFKEDKKTSEGKPKRGEANKIKWERQMPAMIKRVGGRTSKVEKPEDMIKNFNFSGVEFGNWVDDSSGNFHMKKCAEAFMDLADIIGVADKDISLNGRLSMAFGARGQGFGLAHYEASTKAINITKEGGAGSLAHEWGHALDNILYQESVGHSSLNLASDGLGDNGTPEIKAIYKDLMHEILFGDQLGKDYVENKRKTFYSIHPSFKQAVQELGLGGAIKKATDMMNEKHQRSVAYYDGDVRKRYGDATADKYITKEERKHKMAINDMIQEMAYHHEKLTGEVLDKIPAFTGHSQFYVDSSQQAKTSDYWTSNREMFARAFENYIEGKMKSGKVKNDYLVHGTYGTIPEMPAPYPQGVEREKIHKQFDRLIEAIRKAGAIQKGLSFDLQKAIDYTNRLAAMRERKDPEGIVHQRNRNAYNVADTSEVFYIPLNRLSRVYQTTEALNFDKIRENVERMKAGENLEPIVIGYNYDIHDGDHRWEASKIMKYTHVPCVVGGSNEIDIQRAKEAYSEVWKALIFEQLDPKAFPYEATGLMFRGIGQKEFDFIQKEGYIQSKGKGNDGEQGCAVTCFSNLFTQAEGYARSQYDLYHEKQAYVLAVERPLSSEENELGEVEVTGKIPVDMIRGILAVSK